MRRQSTLSLLFGALFSLAAGLLFSDAKPGAAIFMGLQSVGWFMLSAAETLAEALKPPPTPEER